MKSIKLIEEERFCQLSKALLIFFMVLFITSCESDDDVSNNEMKEIEDFLTPKTVRALEDIGFNINSGDDPPNIEGTYHAEHILIATTVPDDPNSPGDTFLDVITKFSNQNSSNIFIERFEMETNTIAAGGVALITGRSTAGETSKFSVFARLNLVDGNDHEFTSLTAISGDIELDSSGNPARILNYQSVGFMLENNGNPYDNLIPNNSGRLFGDEDNSADSTK